MNSEKSQKEENSYNYISTTEENTIEILEAHEKSKFHPRSRKKHKKNVITLKEIDSDLEYF